MEDLVKWEYGEYKVVRYLVGEYDIQLSAPTVLQEGCVISGTTAEHYFDTFYVKKVLDNGDIMGLFIK